tara:strand:- start:705 stop:1073 length:369 start_codon:yes stop_codon:yes gene_type:complete
MYVTNLKLNNEYYDIFDRFFDDGFFNKTEKGYKTESNDDGYTLTMDVPGYNKKLIDVTVEDKHLVIQGKPNTGDAEGFTKKFILSEKFDSEKIEASVSDGILTVDVPFLEETKPRKIKVKVG